MKSKVLAVLTGTLIAFIWSTVSWMFLPWHSHDLKSFSNGEEVRKVISQNIKESGTYTIPNIEDIGHKDDKAQAKWNELSEKGPFAYISIRVEGKRFSMGESMLIQLLTQVLVSIAAVIILLNLKKTNIWKMAQVCTLAITIGAISVQLPHWNWWNFPNITTLVGVLDTAFTWLVASVGMARVLKLNS